MNTGSRGPHGAAVCSEGRGRQVGGEGQEAAGCEDRGGVWGARTWRRAVQEEGPGRHRGQEEQSPSLANGDRKSQETPCCRPESDAGLARGFHGDTDTDRNEN